MSESKSGRHITFFNARLTSTISISLVLFILGIVNYFYQFGSVSG